MQRGAEGRTSQLKEWKGLCVAMRGRELVFKASHYEWIR